MGARASVVKRACEIVNWVNTARTVLRNHGQSWFCKDQLPPCREMCRALAVGTAAQSRLHGPVRCYWVTVAVHSAEV